MLLLVLLGNNHNALEVYAYLPSDLTVTVTPISIIFFAEIENDLGMTRLATHRSSGRSRKCFEKSVTLCTF